MGSFTGKPSPIINGEKSINSEELVLTHANFATNLAKSVIRKLSLPTRFYDDLISCAYVGLVEAAQSYDRDKVADFRSFATARIKGAVIDGLQKSTGVSRTAFRKLREFESLERAKEESKEAIKTLKGEENSSADKEREVGLARILMLASNAAICYSLLNSQSLSDHDKTSVIESAPDENSSPEGDLQRKEDVKRLNEAISHLSEKERTVIDLFYFKDLSLTDIGHSLGLSKSWICKIHAQAVRRLQEFLEGE
jgi:RNA polymerase sigma factor for flagellar operon FliA